MKLWSLLLFAMTLVAQTDAPKTAMGRVIGEVTAKDPAGKQLTVKSDQGTPYTVTLDEKTLFLRVPPGEKDLKKAAKITPGDVKVGDRVMARGTVSEEQKSVPAVSVIVMTKEDLAQKQQREKAEWQSRSVSGVVKSLNADAKEVVISSRTREGVSSLTTLVITPTTRFRRYSTESIRFEDAKPSSLAEIQPGDQMRVLGKKSEDGTRIETEEVIFGTFRTVAGTVISVDAAANEIRMNDLQTKKPVTIKINNDSQLRKLPPMVANMLARRLNPTLAQAGGAGPGAMGSGQGGPGAGGFRQGAGAPGQGGPGGAGPGAGGPGMGAGQRQGQAGGPGAGGPPQGGGFPGGGMGGMGGGMGRGGAASIDQMMERMPAFTLAELQPGEPLIVTTTALTNSNVANAITILSGVEPILRAAPTGAGVNLGSWSLEMNMPMQ